MVESARFECLGCKTAFEAFRRRSVMSSDGKRPVAFEVKLPGGTWERVSGRPAVKCPKCGNAEPAKLRPAAPAPPAPPKGEGVEPPMPPAPTP
jgi:hypothetical protein